MSVLSLYREAKNFDECPSFLNSFMTEDLYHIETSPLICRAMAVIRLLFVEVGFRQIKRKYIIQYRLNLDPWHVHKHLLIPANLSKVA